MITPFFFADKVAIPVSFNNYWFLTVLFEISLFYIFVRFILHIFGYDVILKLCLGMALIVMFFLGFARFTLFYLAMWIFGYFFQRYRWIERIPNLLFSISAMLFLLLVGYFIFGNNSGGTPDRIWLEIPISICASLTVVKIMQAWEGSALRLTAILSYVGKFTLAIYLCHFTFLKISVNQLLVISEINILYQILILTFFLLSYHTLA